MQLTQKNFQDVRQTPIILFVGRPLASRKGLTTLIDAVGILGELNDLPYYKIWIIGGNLDEILFLNRIFSSMSKMKRLFLEDRLKVWGRIENDALPEFYSRSTIAVIPSTFEQFGIVAIEAMACGCPVVASKVGGLKDIIVDGFTGTLIEPENAEILAMVLTSYIRNPERAFWEGENSRVWVQENFSISAVYKDYERLYKNTGYRPQIKFENPIKSFRRILTRNFMPFLEEILGQKVTSFEDYSSSDHITLKIGTSRGIFAAKIFSHRPTFQTSIFPVDLSLKPKYHPRELVNKYFYFAESDFVPKMIEYSFDHAVIVQEWLDDVNFDSMVKEENCLLAVAEIFRGYKPIDENDKIIEPFFQKLTAVKSHGTLQEIVEFDRISAVLNSRLLGGINRFCRIHPQIELLRIRILLDSKLWPIPDNFRLRIIGIIDFLLEVENIVIEIPKLCHGSSKPKHLLKKGNDFIICDLDQALYMVGPMDIAHWIYDRIFRQKEKLAVNAIKKLKELTKDDIDFYLSLCWLSVSLIYITIWNLAHGKTDHLTIINQFFLGYYEALFKTLPILL